MLNLIDIEWRILRRYMESNSWYEDYKKTLDKNDILFSEDEIEKVLMNPLMIFIKIIKLR